MSKPCALANGLATSGLKAQIAALRTQGEPVRRENADGIHDLRVAARRLRAVLSGYRKVLPKKARQDVRNAAREITRDLGKAREFDATLLLLEHERKDLPKKLLPALDQTMDLLRALRLAESPLVSHAAALAGGPDFEKKAAVLLGGSRRKMECVVDLASQSTVKCYKEAVKAHERWRAEKTDEALHKLRIAFKRLRYACEVFRKVYGQEMDEFIGRLKGAQDRLGEWHDLCVAANFVRQARETAPDTHLTAFEGLCARLGARQRAACGKADARMQTFFGSANEKKARAFLRHVHHLCKGRNARLTASSK